MINLLPPPQGPRTKLQLPNLPPARPIRAMLTPIIADSDDPIMLSTSHISPHGPIGSPAQPAFVSWSTTEPRVNPKTPFQEGDPEVEELANLIARAHLRRNGGQNHNGVSDHHSAHSHSPVLPQGTIWSGEPEPSQTKQSRAALSMLDSLAERETRAPSTRANNAPGSIRPLIEAEWPTQARAIQPVLPAGPTDAREGYEPVPTQPSSAPSGGFRPFSLPSLGPSEPANLHGTPADQVTHHLDSLKYLFEPLLASLQEVEGLKKELALWKNEWKAADKDARRLTGLLESKEEKVPSGGRFTAVLLDGDGLIFEDQYLKQGFQGGQRAAQTLLSALPKLLAHATLPLAATREVPEITLDAKGLVVPAEGQDMSDANPEVKELGSVLVQLFVNKSGLGSTLIKNGSVASWAMYDSFWQGFSASHELFIVVDVGTGKEASDAKIRDFLKLYVKNAQCENIVLGASHDNGYATVLSSLQTESRLSKLLLLKGYSDLAPQLRQYSSRVVSIPSLFRATRINLGTQTFSAATQRPDPTPPTPNIKTVKLNGKDGRGGSDTESEEIIEWSTAPSTLKHTLGTAHGKGIGASNGKDKSTPNKKPKEKISKLSAGSTKHDNGVKLTTVASATEGSEDEWKPLKRVVKKAAKAGVGMNKNVEKSIRNLNPRPCHAYYLSQVGCSSGDYCDYGHDYDLSPEQIHGLARLAKEMLCPFIKSNKCRYSDEDCIYGHQCPRLVDCKFGDGCRFKVLPNGHGELDTDPGSPNHQRSYNGGHDISKDCGKPKAVKVMKTLQFNQ